MLRFFFFLFMIFWPVLHVIFSSRVKDKQKTFWLVLVLFLWWPAYLVFIYKFFIADQT
jgi:hypothetical protein